MGNKPFRGELTLEYSGDMQRGRIIIIIIIIIIHRIYIAPYPF